MVRIGVACHVMDIICVTRYVPFRPSDSHRGSCHSVASASEASEAGRPALLPMAAPKPISSCRRDADGSLAGPACGGRPGKWSAEHSSGRSMALYQRSMARALARMASRALVAIVRANKQMDPTPGPVPRPTMPEASP